LIKAFGRSQSVRNKTDKADAALIAQYAKVSKLPAWQPNSETVNKLTELTRRVRHLEKLLRAEKNHAGSGVSSKTSIKSANRTIRFLEKEIAQLQKEIDETIDSDKDLKLKKDLLESIPGIASKTAGIILSEIGRLDKFSSARELAAYIGITPYKRQSGSSLNSRGHISRFGNTRLRTALYFPALVAKRHNSILKEFCSRLKEKGKAGKVIICAAIRKLMHIIFGVLKSGKPFDPNYLNPSLKIT
jgi:transposase